MPKLLAIQSNPDDNVKLRMDREIKEVNRVISPLAAHDFECIYRHAITISELPGLITREKPDIIHFSGHGNKKTLCFEDKTGNSDKIDEQSLAEIFNETAKGVVCLVINACESESLASALTRYVPYVISFPGKIEDELSEVFSITFYENLSLGHSVQSAFNLGKAVIRNKISDKRRLPTIKMNRNLSSFKDVIFSIPYLSAKFILKKNRIPEKYNEMYHFEFKVGNLPVNASYIVFEFLDDTIPTEERFALIKDLSSGSSYSDYLFGDIIIKAWVWFDSKKYGIGLQSTLKEALDNYYGRNLPLYLKPAYQDVISN